MLEKRVGAVGKNTVATEFLIWYNQGEKIIKKRGKAYAIHENYRWDYE